MQQAANQAGYTPKDFCALTSIGMTKLYELKNAGKIKFVKVGRRTIITDDPRDFLSRMGQEAA